MSAITKTMKVEIPSNIPKNRIPKKLPNVRFATCIAKGTALIITQIAIIVVGEVISPPAVTKNVSGL